MGEVKAIHYWYERNWRTWCAYYVDADGNQVGDAEYHNDPDYLVMSMRDARHVATRYLPAKKLAPTSGITR